MPNTLYTFSAFTVWRKENYFCLLKINHNRSHLAPGISSFGRNHKTYTGFYNPYVPDPTHCSGRWSAICQSFWNSPGLLSVGHFMQIWSPTAYGICSWPAEVVTMAIKCSVSCYMATAVVIPWKGKYSKERIGWAASPWGSHGPNFDFSDPEQVTFIVHCSEMASVGKHYRISVSFFVHRGTFTQNSPHPPREE